MADVARDCVVVELEYGVAVLDGDTGVDKETTRLQLPILTP
jgi:hypothetical protein